MDIASVRNFACQQLFGQWALQVTLHSALKRMGTINRIVTDPSQPTPHRRRTECPSPDQSNRAGQRGHLFDDRPTVARQARGHSLVQGPGRRSRETPKRSRALLHWFVYSVEYALLTVDQRFGGLSHWPRRLRRHRPARPVWHFVATQQIGDAAVFDRTARGPT